MPVVEKSVAAFPLGNCCSVGLALCSRSSATTRPSFHFQETLLRPCSEDLHHELSLPPEIERRVIEATETAYVVSQLRLVGKRPIPSSLYSESLKWRKRAKQSPLLQRVSAGWHPSIRSALSSDRYPSCALGRRFQLTSSSETFTSALWSLARL